MSTILVILFRTEENTSHSILASPWHSVRIRFETRRRRSWGWFFGLGHAKHNKKKNNISRTPTPETKAHNTSVILFLGQRFTDPTSETAPARRRNANAIRRNETNRETHP